MKGKGEREEEWVLQRQTGQVVWKQLTKLPRLGFKVNLRVEFACIEWHMYNFGFDWPDAVSEYNLLPFRTP